MSNRAVCSLVLITLVSAALAWPIAAQPASPQLIRLSRATFDPLAQQTAIASALSPRSSSQLRLVQLDGPPSSQTAEQLRSAGMEPLAYIPDRAYVVRLADGARPASVAGVRWQGPFLPAYKLPAELDGQLAQAGVAPQPIRLLAATGADMTALAKEIAAGGGRVIGWSRGLLGATLQTEMPLGALRNLLLRDDVLWAERIEAPLLLNDRSRGALGVDVARARLPWLDGSGQIVAVTDTGLDIQSDVTSSRNPDFAAGRIAAGFSTNNMSAYCYGNDWSDRNGHGTHVAGTILGSGERSGGAYAGMAPGAKLVVQAVSSGGSSLDCFPGDTSFLSKAYNAGARIQNASWGMATGSGSCYFGCYTGFDSDIDQFLWQHKEHLLVVAVGNEGVDCLPKNADGSCIRDGVIDPDSLDTPATAKNVLSVGASENYRPEISLRWGDGSWGSRGVSFRAVPLSADRVADNLDGLAAFSSRGPTDDGRIKPEIVAPGTAIVSAASHFPGVSYYYGYAGGGRDYAYDYGTSMSTPMISGAAALVRQWLAQEGGIPTPSAALVKALLLNGATNIAPGQYGDGAAAEIKPAWPGNAAGWGRANVATSIGLDDAAAAFWDEPTGLLTGASAGRPITASQGQKLRVTLAWTDYPAFPSSGRPLVNDLDLEIVGPDGAVFARGNQAAELGADCRDALSSADRCNNVESVEFSAPVAGTYTLQVRGSAVPFGPQPYALAVGTPGPSVTPSAAPGNVVAGNTAGSPTITVRWDAVNLATSYEVAQRRVGEGAAAATGETVFAAKSTSIVIVDDVGSYEITVRGCNAGGCGPWSAPASVRVSGPPNKYYLPQIGR